MWSQSIRVFNPYEALAKESNKTERTEDENVK